MFGLNKIFGPPLHIKIINEINEEKKELQKTLDVDATDSLSQLLKKAVSSKIKSNIEILIEALDKYNIKFHNTTLSKHKLLKVLNNPLPFEARGFIYYSKYLNAIKDIHGNKIKEMYDLYEYYTLFVSLDEEVIKYKKLYSYFKFFEKSHLNKKMRILYFRKFIDKILAKIEIVEPGLSKVIKYDPNKVEFNKVTMIEFIKTRLRFLELHKKLMNIESQNLDFYVMKSSEKELLEMIEHSKNFKGMILVEV